MISIITIHVSVPLSTIIYPHTYSLARVKFKVQHYFLDNTQANTHFALSTKPTWRFLISIYIYIDIYYHHSRICTPINYRISKLVHSIHIALSTKPTCRFLKFSSICFASARPLIMLSMLGPANSYYLLFMVYNL